MSSLVAPFGREVMAKGLDLGDARCSNFLIQRVSNGQL